MFFEGKICFKNCSSERKIGSQVGNSVTAPQLPPPKHVASSVVSLWAFWIHLFYFKKFEIYHYSFSNSFMRVIQYSPYFKISLVIQQNTCCTVNQTQTTVVFPSSVDTKPQHFKDTRSSKKNRYWQQLKLIDSAVLCSSWSPHFVGSTNTFSSHTTEII